MMYNKNNLLAHLLVDKDANRPELGGVLFKQTETVATDSVSLIRIENLEKMTELSKDAPDNLKVIGSVPKKGYIIPANAVKKALANVSEVNNDIPVLRNVFLSTQTNAEKSELISTNLEKTDKVETNNIVGNYPDFEQIIPDKEAIVSLVLDITKLKKVVDTIAKMDCGEGMNGVALTLDFYGEDQPFILRRNNRKFQKITGIIMPIRK